MIVFSLAILRANLRGESALYPWLLTGIFATLATLANILDVTSLGIPSLIVSASVKALAPIALVLSFELLMTMIKAEVKRTNAIKTIAELDTQLEQKQQQVNTKLEQMLTTLHNRFKQISAENILEALGIKIEYAKGQYADNSEGRLLKNLMADFAEFKREKIKERTVDGRNRAIKAGKVFGSGLTYGYWGENLGVDYVFTNLPYG